MIALALSSILCYILNIHAAKVRQTQVCAGANATEESLHTDEKVSQCSEEELMGSLGHLEARYLLPQAMHADESVLRLFDSVSSCDLQEKAAPAAPTPRENSYSLMSSHLGQNMTGKTGRTGRTPKLRANFRRMNSMAKDPCTWWNRAKARAEEVDINVVEKTGLLPPLEYRPLQLSRSRRFLAMAFLGPYEVPKELSYSMYSSGGYVFLTKDKSGKVMLYSAAFFTSMGGTSKLDFSMFDSAVTGNGTLPCEDSPSFHVTIGPCAGNIRFCYKRKKGDQRDLGSFKYYPNGASTWRALTLMVHNAHMTTFGQQLLELCRLVHVDLSRPPQVSMFTPEEQERFVKNVRDFFGLQTEEWFGKYLPYAVLGAGAYLNVNIQHLLYHGQLHPNAGSAYIQALKAHNEVLTNRQRRKTCQSDMCQVLVVVDMQQGYSVGDETQFSSAVDEIVAKLNDHASYDLIVFTFDWLMLESCLNYGPDAATWMRDLPCGGTYAAQLADPIRRHDVWLQRNEDAFKDKVVVITKATDDWMAGAIAKKGMDRRDGASLRFRAMKTMHDQQAWHPDALDVSVGVDFKTGSKRHNADVGLSTLIHTKLGEPDAKKIHLHVTGTQLVRCVLKGAIHARQYGHPVTVYRHATAWHAGDIKEQRQDQQADRWKTCPTFKEYLTVEAHRRSILYGQMKENSYAEAMLGKDVCNAPPPQKDIAELNLFGALYTGLKGGPLAFKTPESALKYYEIVGVQVDDTKIATGGRQKQRTGGVCTLKIDGHNFDWRWARKARLFPKEKMLLEPRRPSADPLLIASDDEEAFSVHLKAEDGNTIDVDTEGKLYPGIKVVVTKGKIYVDNVELQNENVVLCEGSQPKTIEIKSVASHC